MGVLDAVYLIDKQILVTDEVLEEILHIPPKLEGQDDYERAEEDRLILTFDWHKVLEVIAQSDSTWIYGTQKSGPKSIAIKYLTIEARVWHQILTNYVMPSTYETDITADMAVFIWCALEGKQMYLPRLVRKYMGRAHIMGNLAFPCLNTRLALRAEVVWEDADERPTIAGTPAPKQPQLAAAPPSPLSQPIHHLVQRLFEEITRLERRRK
ncbi:uncharacterized protein DS421_3g104480 [Arachis hypogaea]|nr:uncharacterized protein DS421_3g104480 [Arachis hypogaea]